MTGRYVGSGLLLVENNRACLPRLMVLAVLYSVLLSDLSQRKVHYTFIMYSLVRGSSMNDCVRLFLGVKPSVLEILNLEMI
jgi:hypothetical protein